MQRLFDGSRVSGWEGRPNERESQLDSSSFRTPARRSQSDGTALHPRPRVLQALGCPFADGRSRPRTIYQDHAALVRRRGAGLSFFSLPPRAANRRALSRVINASNPRRTRAVFSFTPVSITACLRRPSSMVRVVLICGNMHPLCRYVKSHFIELTSILRTVRTDRSINRAIHFRRKCNANNHLVQLCLVIILISTFCLLRTSTCTVAAGFRIWRVAAIR